MRSILRRPGTFVTSRRPWLLAALMAVIGVLAPCLVAVTGAVAATYPDPEPISGATYAHDPSMIKTASGRYYLFYTGGGIQVSTSTDRTHWSADGQVLPNGAAWAKAYGGWNDLWAPDVSYHNGVYWLYYAVSSFGSNHSAVGLATSTTAAPGSWTDQGMVYQSQSTSDYNAIDPALMVDSSGRWWLSFGSFWSGIKMIQIDPSTGKQLASNTRRYSIAQRPSPDALEASYIYRHSGYYYLFTSFGYCCRGTSSTYRIMVARATSPTGPYVDENGVSATSGGGTQILGTHDFVIGPGGQTVMTDSDGDVLVYHYYDANLGGTAQLGLNHLSWGADGWPTVGQSAPGGSGYVRVENRATGLFIDGEGRTSNGSNAGQWGSSGSYNQQWQIVPDGSYVRLENRATGLYLDGEGRTSDGSAVGQWSGSGSGNQQWLETTEGGYARFQNRATGLYIDGEGRTSNGSDLGQWSDSNSGNQQWEIVS